MRFDSLMHYLCVLRDTYLGLNAEATSKRTMLRWAVAVAQLAEQSVPLSEVRSSNPVVGEILYRTCFECKLLKRRKKEKRDREWFIKKLFDSFRWRQMRGDLLYDVAQMHLYDVTRMHLYDVTRMHLYDVTQIDAVTQISVGLAFALTTWTA